MLTLESSDLRVLDPLRLQLQQHGSPVLGCPLQTAFGLAAALDILVHRIIKLGAEAELGILHSESKHYM